MRRARREKGVRRGRTSRKKKKNDGEIPCPRNRVKKVVGQGFALCKVFTPTRMLPPGSTYSSAAAVATGVSGCPTILELSHLPPQAPPSNRGPRQQLTLGEQHGLCTD